MGKRQSWPWQNLNLECKDLEEISLNIFPECPKNIQEMKQSPRYMIQNSLLDICLQMTKNKKKNKQQSISCNFGIQS